MAAPVIRSRSNAVVRRFRASRQRADKVLAVLEGTKLVEEALAAGVEVAEVAASPRLGQADRGRRLLEALAQRRVPVHLMDEDVLASVSEVETSQGILALVRRPLFGEDALYRGRPLVLVAMGIQNPGNVGALLRAAEAAGATGSYLAEGCADPFSWKALRGSMGSALRFPHLRGVDARDAMARLESRGVATVAATSSAGTPYDEVDLARPVAVIVGSEGAGLEEDLLARASARVTIPMLGGVESLNVAVAAGILLFEAARQRRG